MNFDINKTYTFSVIRLTSFYHLLMFLLRNVYSRSVCVCVYECLYTGNHVRCLSFAIICIRLSMKNKYFSMNTTAMDGS